VGRLATIGKTILTVYANDHLPPHFHAITPDDEALIEIATLTILRGDLRPATRRKVLAWATANRQALVAEWNRLNPRFPTE
jgi:hypothetical protein